MNIDRYELDQYKVTHILADTKISSGAKLLLLHFIFRLGGKNYCFPSQKKISENIGLSSRQVRNLLNELKNNNIIQITHGSINPNTKKEVNSNTYDLTNILKKTI